MSASELSESIKKRIELIKEAGEDYDALKKHLCPFFEKGGHPDCAACHKTEANIDECRDYYLSRIHLFPMDVWEEKFDSFVVQAREKVAIENITGIGINCDSCYMADKCPLFKRGYACAIDWGTNKPKNATEFMDFLINVQYERVRRASVFEKIDGGVPDANLSNEMDRLSGYIASKDSLGQDRLSINVEAKGKSGGGILASLFGGKPAVEEHKVEDVSAEEVPVEALEDKSKDAKEGMEEAVLISKSKKNDRSKKALAERKE